MSSQAIIILIIIVIDTRPWPPFDRLAKLGSSSGDQSGRIKVLTLLDLHRSARRGSNFFIHLFCAIYTHFPTCQNYYLTLPNNFHTCQTDFLTFFKSENCFKKKESKGKIFKKFDTNTYTPTTKQKYCIQRKLVTDLNTLSAEKIKILEYKFEKHACRSEIFKFLPNFF